MDRICPLALTCGRECKYSRPVDTQNKHIVCNIVDENDKNILNFQLPVEALVDLYKLDGILVKEINRMIGGMEVLELIDLE